MGNYRIAWKRNPKYLVPAYWGKKFLTKKKAENAIKKNIGKKKFTIIKR